MNVMDNTAIKYYSILDAEQKKAFSSRLINASYDEIALLADLMWEDVDLGAMFRRLGKDGDMEGARGAFEPPYPKEIAQTEWHRTWAFIEEFQKGPRWGLRQLDLWLATGLCRLRAGGVLDDFRSPEALQHIEDRRVNPRSGHYAIIKKPYGIAEVLDLARVMIADEDFCEFLRTRSNNPSNDEHDEQLQIMYEFESPYMYKYCLWNRRIEDAIHVAAMVAKGVAENLEDPKIIARIIQNPDIRKYEESRK